MTSTQETETLYAQLVSKAVLNPDEEELYELTRLAGITMDSEMFKILLDLLKLNVPPVAIVQTLRSMCSSHPKYPNDENQPPSSSAEDLRLESHASRNKSGESGLSSRKRPESYRGQSTSSERQRKGQGTESQGSSGSYYSQSASTSKTSSGAARPKSTNYDNLPSSSYRRTGSSSSSTQLSGYRDGDRNTKKRSSYHQ